ncbi:acyclic terpene utilization AtuA family protein [Cupriavidus taiwanensis]|uniref:acyclic terpene utilization AtuA family protein n=1 Tax=Cupriavidus taiwanensis TaxID=164546 RepID=UPI000E184612|nr:acyclic terpene utilization AtuA family protein [Cupriavidus taiwanensis]SOZ29849.1 ABC transporter substrate-binding protein [Cupriavidus taiwanensis]SPA34654.1 ABC transporter substrate-binding protein [Cupriavidus taiwanensis]
MTKTTLRVGSGSGWWGDRVEPAALSARLGRLDYLCFETMAEATVSAAQVRRRRDPAFAGYDTYLDERMRAVLPHCLANGTRIISNQGWIHPLGAARRIAQICEELGLPMPRIAAITTTDLTPTVCDQDLALLESGAPVASLRGTLISAEPYEGALPIVKALEQGAQIVVTGRVADPSLFLAPMIHAFGWDYARDVDLLARGSAIGHLLECGAQATGGYFGDPGYKDVPEPWNLAFPIAEVDADGKAVIGKVAGTGGRIDLQTIKEQMFYEVHDPARYITPDVVVDFTTAALEQVAPDRVRISGVRGAPRTGTLKVSLGCTEGFIGEDMFFYAGPGCLAKAELARVILEQRFALAKLQAEELRIDFLGVNAIHGAASPVPPCEPNEIAVRVAARTRTREEAAKVGREIDSMAVCGLASTGKRVPHQDRTREIIGVWSALVPRAQVESRIHFL